jgi:hypothetical protein
MAALACSISMQQGQSQRPIEKVEVFPIEIGNWTLNVKKTEISGSHKVLHQVITNCVPVTGLHSVRVELIQQEAEREV